MTDMWTVLVITILSGPFEGSQSYLIYPSYDACFDAHQIVAATLPYDYKIACEETDTASRSIRPRRNPRG
jgi:hypothetical protein